MTKQDVFCWLHVIAGNVVLLNLSEWPTTYVEIASNARYRPTSPTTEKTKINKLLKVQSRDPDLLGTAWFIKVLYCNTPTLTFLVGDSLGQEGGCSVEWGMNWKNERNLDLFPSFCSGELILQHFLWVWVWEQGMHWLSIHVWWNSSLQRQIRRENAILR